jgi:glycosyltransferase involved in cell wall biosynthesis
MKIAVVSPGYPPTRGGVETVVAHTARALVRAGHQVEVLSDERDAQAPVMSDDHGVVVRRFACNEARTYRVAPDLWRHLAAHSGEFDVVHAHSYHAPIAALTALSLGRSRSDTPLVISPHYHGTGHTRPRALLHRLWRPVGATALHRARVIVCVSRAEQHLVQAHFPRVAAKTMVVPNAVDVATIGSTPPFTTEPPTVLGMGRLEAYKRFDLLVEAFAAATRPARYADESTLAGSGRPQTQPQLVIIGDGPERERLVDLARRLGVDERVVWLSDLPTMQVHRWLRTASVFCSLSEHEAYGLAPAEALVAGTTCVLSPIPAHRELADAAPSGAVSLVEPNPSRISEVLATTLTGRGGARIPGASPLGAGVMSWDQSAQCLARALAAAVNRPTVSISHGH